MRRQAQTSNRRWVVCVVGVLGLLVASTSHAESSSRNASPSVAGVPDVLVGAQLDGDAPRVFSSALPFELAPAVPSDEPMQKPVDESEDAPIDFWLTPLSAALEIPTRVALAPQRALCLALPCRSSSTSAATGDEVFSPSRTNLRAMVEHARLEVGEAWSLKPSLRWMQSVSRTEIDKLRGLLTRNGPRIDDAVPLVLLDLNLRYRASERLAFDVRVNNVAESDGVQLYTSEFGGREFGHRTVSLGLNYDF